MRVQLLIPAALMMVSTCYFGYAKVTHATHTLPDWGLYGVACEIESLIILRAVPSLPPISCYAREETTKSRHERRCMTMIWPKFCMLYVARLPIIE